MSEGGGGTVSRCGCEGGEVLCLGVHTLSGSWCEGVQVLCLGVRGVVALCPGAGVRGLMVLSESLFCIHAAFHRMLISPSERREARLKSRKATKENNCNYIIIPSYFMSTVQLLLSLMWCTAAVLQVDPGWLRVLYQLTG